MDELISKKTVLDAIDEISREVDDGDGFDYAKWREYFCELPSVHGTNMAEVDTDSISRQQAIEAVQNRHMMLTKEKTLLINDLEKLPSAQPKRIRGKWIRNGWAITCSECGYDMPYTVRNFCPNCGADMRGEQDERDS